MRRKLVLRTFMAVMGFAALLGCAALLWFWHLLSGGVAALDGEMKLPGLEAPVTIARDKAGVPTVTAATRLDLARALGFLHAQERFFQMDTIRKSGAGELSELAGEAAVALDKSHRVHRFRSRAKNLLANMPPEHRKLIDAYTEGVNGGLSALSHKPFEYTLLRADPAPWRAEDTLLAIYAMYFELQDSNGWVQRRKALAQQALGPSLARFLYPEGEPSDAALDGSVLPEAPMPAQQALPAPAADNLAVPATSPPPPNGSNAFAVAGSRTSSGRAIVANDMHLPLRVPNIWYRARLQVRQAELRGLDLSGVTLPGVPLLVAGTNGNIAWGLTDAFIVAGDAVRLERVPGDARAYLTPKGPASLTVFTEKICPARSRCRNLEVEESIWGPVVAHEADGTPIVWRWTAHDGNAIDFNGLIAFETASTVREAFDAAHRAGMPQQNLVAVDHEGHAGWTIMGQVPKRVALDGLPHSWADGSRGWQGYLAAGEIPEIIDPADGLIWSANNREVGGQALSLLGDGGYASAGRARSIRDDLRAKDRFSEKDLLAIQLEIRAPELDPWQKLLTGLLEKRADASSQAMLNYVKGSSDTASTGSVGYRLVRSFEEEAVRLVYGGFGGAIARNAGHDAGPLIARRAQWPSLRLMTERPAYLVPPPFNTWDEVMDELASRLTNRVRDEARGRIEEFTWGNRNHSAIHHPLAVAIPALGLLTDPADVPLPGDTLLPRTAAPGYGATERFVISPGHEDEGIFEMPVGEASNPASPYFLAGHEDWVKGRTSPFLAGPSKWVLVLKP